MSKYISIYSVVIWWLTASSFQTLNNVFEDVRYNTGKDSNTLIDADLLRLANKYFSLLFREIVGLREDFYAELSSADLVQSQREYTLPTDSTSSPYGGGFVKLQRVEVSYDGSNWYVADPISLQQIPTPTILDADINNEFAKTNPKYWFKDGSVWLAPVPGSSDDVAASNANLRIFWIKRPDEMTTSGDIPEMSKDFLSVLSAGMLRDVFRRLGKVTEMRDAGNEWLLGIQRMKELESHPDQEQQIILMPAKKNYK